MPNPLDGIHGLEIVEQDSRDVLEPYALGRCLCGASSWPEYYTEHTILTSSVSEADIAQAARDDARAAVQAWFDNHMIVVGRFEAAREYDRAQAWRQNVGLLESDLGTDRLIYHHPEGFVDE